MKKNYKASLYTKQFNCVYCEVYAQQKWDNILHSTGTPLDIVSCQCEHCKKRSYWHKKNEEMIFPLNSIIELAHPEMPEEIIEEYNEARNVFMFSPRSSAALLRLAIQKLMPILGEKGHNINNDIASLTKKGLHSDVQKALDICRVIGNNAVHPGTIDLNESPENTRVLFSMINFIIEEQISKPKLITNIYEQLPENSREAIKKRDA